jgi:hypothetical protein
MDIESSLLPPTTGLEIPLVEIGPELIENLKHGKKLQNPGHGKDETVGLTDSEGRLLGLGKVYGDAIQPDKVFLKN